MPGTRPSALGVKASVSRSRDYILMRGSEKTLFVFLNPPTQAVAIPGISLLDLFALWTYLSGQKKSEP